MQKRNSILFIVSVVLLVISFSLASCDFFDDKIQLPEGKITDIDHASDSSVLVRVVVTKKSNADESCFFQLLVDTISYSPNTYNDYSFKSYKSYLLSNVCNLDQDYHLTVTGLVKHKKYYFQLYASGGFNIGKIVNKRDVVGPGVDYTIN